MEVDKLVFAMPVLAVLGLGDREQLQRHNLVADDASNAVVELLDVSEKLEQPSEQQLRLPAPGLVLRRSLPTSASSPRASSLPSARLDVAARAAASSPRSPPRPRPRPRSSASPQIGRAHV